MRDDTGRQDIQDEYTTDMRFGYWLLYDQVAGSKKRTDENTPSFPPSPSTQTNTKAARPQESGYTIHIIQTWRFGGNRGKE